MLEIREKAVSPVQLEVSPRLASPSVTSLQGTIVVFMDKTTIVAELRDVTMVAWLLRHRQVLHSFRATVRQVAAWVLSGTWQLTKHLLQHGVVRLAVLEIREKAVSPVQLEVSPRLERGRSRQPNSQKRGPSTQKERKATCWTRPVIRCTVDHFDQIVTD